MNTDVHETNPPQFAMQIISEDEALGREPGSRPWCG